MAPAKRQMARRWMRPCCVLLFQLFLVSALSSATAKEPQTPEQMYEYAVRQLDRGYYEKAVMMFERIKTRYPFSKYAVLSELRIGDAHFKKGEYLEAVDAYRNFIKLHPRHPELDYVVYRIGLSQFKDAPKWVQRDQTSTRQMLATIARFDERFPDSEYLDEVLEMRAEGRSRLARGVFAIGQFYYRRGRYNTRGHEREAAFGAALGRFEQVLDEYPDVTDVAVDAMYHIGLIHLSLGEMDKAAETLDRLKSRYPDADSAIDALGEKVARALERTERGEARQRRDELEPGGPGAGGSDANRPEPWGTLETTPAPPRNRVDNEEPPPPSRREDDDFMPALEPGPTEPGESTGPATDGEAQPPVENPDPPPPPVEDDFMPLLEPATGTSETGQDAYQAGGGASDTADTPVPPRADP